MVLFYLLLLVLFNAIIFIYAFLFYYWWLLTGYLRRSSANQKGIVFDTSSRWTRAQMLLDRSGENYLDLFTARVVPNSAILFKERRSTILFSSHEKKTVIILKSPIFVQSEKKLKYLISRILKKNPHTRIVLFDWNAWFVSKPGNHAYYAYWEPYAKHDLIHNDYFSLLYSNWRKFIEYFIEFELNDNKLEIIAMDDYAACLPFLYWDDWNSFYTTKDYKSSLKFSLLRSNNENKVKKEENLLLTSVFHQNINGRGDMIEFIYKEATVSLLLNFYCNLMYLLNFLPPWSASSSIMLKVISNMYDSFLTRLGKALQSELITSFGDISPNAYLWIALFRFKIYLDPIPTESLLQTTGSAGGSSIAHSNSTLLTTPLSKLSRVRSSSNYTLSFETSTPILETQGLIESEWGLLWNDQLYIIKRLYMLIESKVIKLILPFWEYYFAKPNSTQISIEKLLWRLLAEKKLYIFSE